MSQFAFPPSPVLSAPAGTWPATDDGGLPLKITYNPLRAIPHGRNKEIITKFSGYGTKCLLSGPVAAVIDFILFTNEDTVTTKSFLLGYLPYLTPAQLFQHIGDIIQQKRRDERGRLTRSTERRILKFVRDWVDAFGFRDFQRRSFAVRVLTFFCETLSRDSSNRLKLLFIRLFRQKKMLHSVITSTSLTPSGSGKELYLEDLTPNLVADYLTSVEFVMYKAIQPWEFLSQAWQREDKQVRAPNLSALIARFNQVSNWVASQIVQTKDGHAARMISHFIEIAHRLFDMNNYNTLMEILSGLNNANIARLRAIWAEVPAKDKEQFEKLDEAMAPQANFRAYRELMKAKRDQKEFVFPYLAVHLRDLTFVNEANPDYTPNKFLNFEKLSLQGGTVLDLISFKRPELQLVVDDSQVMQWLQTMRALNEDEIREVSLRLVPLKTLDTSDSLVPILLSNTHQQWGPSALIRTVETKQLTFWKKDDIELYLSRAASKSACECLVKQVRSGPQLLHLTEDNLVSLGVSKESLSPLLAALKILREQNPDSRVEMSSLLEREPRLWSVLDVAQWLIAIGLGALRQIFIFHLIDGRGLFELTDQLLSDMQIRDPVHRSRILRKIALLRERHPNALNDEDDSSEIEASPSGSSSYSTTSNSNASADSSDLEKNIVWCYYEDTKVELRLVGTDYKRFKRALRKSFGGAHIRIKYQSADGELVVVKSSQDLAAAMVPGKDGNVNVYLFAKRRKRLTYTGGERGPGVRPDSPGTFLRGNTGSIRVRSRSGSQQGSLLGSYRERSQSSTGLVLNSARSEGSEANVTTQSQPPEKK